MDKEQVYIKMNKKASIEVGENVLIKDLGTVYSPNPYMIEAVGKISVKEAKQYEDWDYVKATDIAEKVFDKYAYIDLTLLGEVETLLEFKSKEEPKPFTEFIKVVLVSILLFFGASLAIINFHEDVNSSKTMKDLYFIFTGEKKDNPLLMVIPYCFGIGIGVITFFFRVLSSSKRRRKEPGPMEIELFLFDEDMEKQIINETKKLDE